MTVHEWRMLIVSSRLRPLSRLVAHTIATHADVETLETWIGIDTIVRESGCSESSVHKAIRELRSSGYLYVTYRGFGFQQESNLYRLLKPAWLAKKAA